MPPGAPQAPQAPAGGGVTPVLERQSSAVGSAPPVAVPSRLLVGLYAVVPLVLLCAWVDHALLDGALRRRLPAAPEDIPLWTLVFNVPHVLASSVLLIDREYLGFYRVHIAVGLGAVVALTLLHATAPLVVTLWVAAALLSYHLMAQQVGISRLLGGSPDRALGVWKGLAGAVLMLSAVHQLPQLHLPKALGMDAAMLGGLLCLPLSYCAFRVYRSSLPGAGRIHVLGNQVLLLSLVPMAVAGYGLLSVVMVRVVHDLSAFAFYLVHDHNRARGGERNLLYAALGRLGVPRALALLTVSIGLGQVIIRAEPAELMHPVAMVSMFHYYMEFVAWRRDGLHRRAVRLG